MKVPTQAPGAAKCLLVLLLAGCAGSQKKGVLPSASDAETPEVPFSSPGARSTQADAAHDPQARAALERALELVRRADYTAAERELKQLVDHNPSLDYGWTNLGVVYEREALPQQAERAYRKALELKPDQEEAWIYLARLYCRTGRASQMEAELRGRIQQSPTSLGVRTALVFVLTHQGKYEPAGGEAKKILKADERNVRAMQLLAQVYYRQGKYELAKMVLENGKAIDANDAATYNELGLVNLAFKARPAALENFKRAVELKPDFAEAKNNLGALLNDAQDYDYAIRELEGAVNAAPDFVDARLNLGNAYRGKQEFSKALSQYKQVIKLNPDLPDTYYNLAILHLDSELPNMPAIDRFKSAIAYFNQYREKGGKDERVEQYLKDANKGIEKEQRRAQRERKEQLKKAEKPPVDSTSKLSEQTAEGISAVTPAAATSSEGDAAPAAASKSKGKPKSSARKKRTVVSPNTPASNQGAADEEAAAPNPATSGKLAGQGK